MFMFSCGLGLLSVATIVIFAALPKAGEIRFFLRKEGRQAGIALVKTGAFTAGLTRSRLSREYKYVARDVGLALIPKP